VAYGRNGPGAFGRLRQRVSRFLLRDLWHLGGQQEPRFRSFLIHKAQLVFLVIRGFREHRCSTRAAALTFITVFGLVPFLAVTLSVMNGFADLKPYEDQVIDFLVERFIPTVAPGRAKDDSAAGAPSAKLQGLRRPVRDNIKRFIGNIQYGKIGMLALLFCIGVFYYLLSSVEATFNTIWGVKRQRAFFQKLRTYWMLVIVPLLIAAYAASVSAVGARLGAYPSLERIFRLLSEAGFVWLAFLSLYALLPNTRVQFSTAAVGALCGAVLLELVKHSTLLAAWLFGYRAETLAEIYGASVAVVPVFLFVIFVLWLIALFGAELSYACQNVRSYARDRRTLALNQVSRERLGLQLLLDVSKRFDRADPAPSIGELSDQFDVSTALVRDTLELFERGELVRSSGEGLDTTWQPAKPLDRITAADAIYCLRQANGDELETSGIESDASDRYLSALASQAERRAASVFEGLTLREVLDRGEEESEGTDQAE